MVKSVLLTVGCFILITCNLIAPMNSLPMKDENSMGRVKRNIVKSQASSSASATDSLAPLTFGGASLPFANPYGIQKALLQKIFSALGLGTSLNEILAGLGEGVVGSNRPSGFFPGGLSGLGQSPLLSFLGGSFAQSDSVASAIGG